MRNEIGSFSRRFAFLKGTLFHPQWFAHRQERSLFEFIGSQSGTHILDIGCSDQRIKKYLAQDCKYLGLDYYSTATQWYETRPAIYGDAHALPFANAKFETVLLLDVLEHLRSPETCMTEIARVLKNGGNLFLKVPFLYPIHDAPADFHRWTRFGLTQLAQRHGFQIIDERHIGEPVETAALLTNIAWSKTVLRWVQVRNPLMIFGLLLPAAVVLSNVVCALAAKLAKTDDMMPHSYMLVLQKSN
jgi:SAM-dependent methyltransferase